MKAPWVTYRPELKVLDCTIRDGGLINDHQFDEKFVKAVYQTCVDAGIDYMEIGYKASKKLFARNKFGAWKFCDEDDLRRVVGDNKTDVKLAVMADADKSDYRDDILPKSQSVIDVIRVATYVNQIPTAVDMIKDAYDKGYEVTCNLMAVSTVQEPELDQALEVLATTPATTVVVVDSFGSLYAEQIEILVKKYMQLPQRDRQGSRHPRPQQPAARLRQHHRGDHPRGQPRRRHHGRPGPRGRQLPDGTADRLPAEPEVQAPPDPQAAAGARRADAQDGRVGAAGALQHHRAAQPAPAIGHQDAGRRQAGQLRRLLRQLRVGRVRRGGNVLRSRTVWDHSSTAIDLGRA